MYIAIMNYATGEVTIINGCPDDWTEEQTLEYLYGESGLHLRESDTFYMAGDEISLSEKDYSQTKGE